MIAFNPNAEIYNSNLSTLEKVLKNLYLYIESKFQSHTISIQSCKHFDYHEIYSFENKNDKSSCSLRLYYNGKYQITGIKTINSIPSEFAIEIEELITSSVRLETNFQRQIYNLIKEKLAIHKILIKSVEHHNFREVYYLKLGGDKLKLCIDYNSDGFVTRFAPLGFTDIKFVETVRLALEL